MTYDPQSSAGGSNGGGSGFRGSLGGGGAGASGIGDRLGGAKDKVLGGFNRLVDAAERNIHRAPEDIQPAARKAVDVARERPMLTMLGLAAAAFVLTRGSRRR